MADPEPGRTTPDGTEPRPTAFAETETDRTAEPEPARTIDPFAETQTDRTADPVAGQERTSSPAVQADDRAPRAVAAERAEVARPAETQPVLEPAVDSAPQAPKQQGNRLVGTAWVLLAAGLFQVVYFGAVAALVALLAGPQFVGAQLTQYASTPFAWLPVLFFFLLFELTVLLFNRAGRFLYVVASLVVGLLVYVLSVLLINSLLRGGVGDRATLEQAFLNPLFVLTGLAAREVMLWTGVAIGARGTRVRKRNRAARDSYRAEVGEQSHAG